MPYPKELLDRYQALSEPNDTLHRMVEDIVASYNSAWDPLTELIQNSVDAIMQRSAAESPGFKGRILIAVDATSSQVTIEDNGTGIPPNQRDAMILPGGSLKRQLNTYGHKGLGFTYCAHVAAAIEVDTEDQNGNKEHWSFDGGFSWLNDPNDTPIVSDTGHATLRTMSGSGTAVRMTFAIGDYEIKRANTAVLDKFFDWANDEKLMSFVLRTRTAIGQVDTLFGKPLRTDIEIWVKFGNAPVVPVEYKFFEFFNYAPLSQESHPNAVQYSSHVYHNPKNPNKVHYGIYHVYESDVDEDGTTLPLRVGKHKGGVNFQIYIYACGRDNLAQALAQYEPRLTNGFSYLAFTTDVHLAIDGMPCGVPIDSWNNYGSFEQRYFAIVNAELSFGRVLDAGRKTITRYYVDLIVDKIVQLTKQHVSFSPSSLYDLAAQLHTRSAVPPGRRAIDLLGQWAKYSDLPVTELLFQKKPQDEIGTYILFAELVGRGLMPGYRFRYVSSAAVYDAALSFGLDLSDKGNVNQSVTGGNCTLGVGSALVQVASKMLGFPNYQWREPNYGHDHLVVEFKVRAEDLLREVQKRKSEKDLRYINILVCVEFDANEVSNLQGVIVKVTPAARRFSGVTHQLSAAGQTIEVISLVEAIDALKAAGKLK